MVTTKKIVDARHVRNAISRFDQVEDVTNAERDRAWKRIVAAAKKKATKKTATKKTAAKRA